MRLGKAGILAGGTLFAAGAAGLLGVGCASGNGFRDIAVTRDPSVVASCQKVDDVRIEKPPRSGSAYETPGRIDTPGRDTAVQLSDKARAKGANTLLITSDPPRETEPVYATGIAYSCSALPGAGAPPVSSAPSSPSSQ